MGNFQIEVLENDDSHLIRTESQVQQRNKFADCVILTITGPVYELVRGRPIVLLIPNGRVQLIGPPIHKGVYLDELIFLRKFGNLFQKDPLARGITGIFRGRRAFLQIVRLLLRTGRDRSVLFWNFLRLVALISLEPKIDGIGCCLVGTPVAGPRKTAATVAIKMATLPSLMILPAIVSIVSMYFRVFGNAQETCYRPRPRI